MKTAIGILFVIAIVLTFLASRAGKSTTNPDDYGPLVFFGFAAIVAWAADGLLLIGYALWRLFTT